MGTLYSVIGTIMAVDQCPLLLSSAVLDVKNQMTRKSHDFTHDQTNATPPRRRHCTQQRMKSSGGAFVWRLPGKEQTDESAPPVGADEQYFGP